MCYLNWFCIRGLKLTEAPNRLSSSESDVTQAIRKYLYGVPLNPRR